MSDHPPFTRDTIPVIPWGPSATSAETAASVEQHHLNCYQSLGIPDDLPANLCDCRVLRMIDNAANPESSQPEPLECNAMGIEHEAHVYSFGSGEDFTCPGWANDGDCTDECPEDCEADHQGEE